MLSFNDGDLFLTLQPQNQQEEGHKITVLRRAYQRAVETPMHNLEAIWKEYDAFENDLNKILVCINEVLSFHCIFFE